MTQLPKSLVINQLLSSRYGIGAEGPKVKRPENWDERIAGIDSVLADDGNRYELYSDGQQSPPQKGWKIILRDGDNRQGFRWTLYGFS